MNRRGAEEKRNKELRELAERNLHKLPAGHYRLGGFGMSIKPFDAQTEAAASDKSSTEMATGVIRDLRKHNYGNAERNVAILIAQLEQEEQEIRRVTAQLAEIKQDAFMDRDAFLEALGEVIRGRDETERELTEIKQDAFVDEIERRIANLVDCETEVSAVRAGAIRGYEAALRLYRYHQRTH